MFHHRIGALLLAAALSACSLNPAPLAPKGAGDLMVGRTNLLFAGDALPVYNVRGDQPATLTIRRSGATETKELPIPRADAPTQLVVDAATFPGLDTGNLDAVQVYELRLTRAGTDGTGGESTRTVTVVADRNVKAFPDPAYQLGDPSQGPPGKGPNAWNASAAAAADVEAQALVDHLKGKLGVADLSQATAPLAKAQVALLPGFDAMPADTPLTRYTLTGALPRMYVPARYTSTGVDGIFAPASVALVVSRTTPAVLVSLRVAP